MRRWCVERLDPDGTTVNMVALREKEQAKEQVRRWHTPTVDGHTAKLTYRTPTPEETTRWHPSIRDFQRYVEEYLANLQRTREPSLTEAQQLLLREVERSYLFPPSVTEPRRRRPIFRRRNREGLAD